MAGGRDLKPQAPRWFDWLVCSSGLTSAACFIWRVLLCDGEASHLSLSPGALIPRLLGVAVLPVLLFVTVLEKAARRLVE
jgi:hypothetical protein